MLILGIFIFLSCHYLPINWLKLKNYLLLLTLFCYTCDDYALIHVIRTFRNSQGNWSQIDEKRCMKAWKVAKYKVPRARCTARREAPRDNIQIPISGVLRGVKRQVWRIWGSSWRSTRCTAPRCKILQQVQVQHASAIPTFPA